MVADDLRKQAKTGAGRLGRVPLVLVGIFVLQGQQLHEHRRNFGQRDLGKVVRHVCRLLVEFERFGGLERELNFLITHRGPELDGLERHMRLGIAHAQHREAKKRLLHVEAHLVVV